MNLPIKLGQLITCLNCGTEFRTGRKHRKGVKYCSRDCWKIHWKGENTHMFGKDNLTDKGRERLSKLHEGNTHALGNKLTKETKEKMSKSKSGDKHWNWKIDRSQVLLDKERGGPLHKQWSHNVKNRDGWNCRISDQNCQGKVVAHHILPWSTFPDLRYKLNNGITLCHSHHPRKREDERKLSPYFQSMIMSNSN